jgi:hypothetical protein
MHTCVLIQLSTCITPRVRPGQMREAIGRVAFPCSKRRPSLISSMTIQIRYLTLCPFLCASTRHSRSMVNSSVDYIVFYLDITNNVVVPYLKSFLELLVQPSWSNWEASTKKRGQLVGSDHHCQALPIESPLAILGTAWEGSGYFALYYIMKEFWSWRIIQTYFSLPIPISHPMNNLDPVSLYDEAIRFHGQQWIHRLGVIAAEFDIDFLRGHLAVVHKKIHNPETREVKSLHRGLWNLISC